MYLDIDTSHFCEFNAIYGIHFRENEKKITLLDASISSLTTATVYHARHVIWL